MALSNNKSRRDEPYVMKLGNGRVVYVEVPGQWTMRERGGEVSFLPPAVRFLDQIRALAMRVPPQPTPGFVQALRRGLGLTQRALADALQVDALTVSRWERGQVRPGRASVAALEKLRQKLVRRGVTLSA